MSDTTPPATLVEGFRSAKAGAEAARTGKDAQACPYPADGDVVQRFHRHFWMLGYDNPGRHSAGR
ncbi:Rmf/CrpP family protein [Actinacidiphila sp. bgisy160]|uniref:Rmf/CrpP family protein n=1 Tax=Actinacidiphila sp. bgisy160 TaxID=3413796 RepID=UPI003D70B4A9